MSPFESHAALERILERSRKGDQRAWAELVERFQKLVYSIPRQMGLSTDDAADVFQSTFFALLKNLDRIENSATLPKWLSVTASRECLRILRTSGKTTTLGDQEGMTLDELVADEEASAEDHALISERRYEVSAALEKIPERCRKLLGMLYGDDEKEYKEIAEELSMPIGAIGPTRARCLDKLRAVLEMIGFFDEH